MAKDKFNKSISWSDLQSLGNPDNAPETELNSNNSTTKSSRTLNDKVRVYVEKKGRSGKKVTLIKGLTLAAPQLDHLAKQIKSKCGVGGKREGKDIMIQGDQRKKIMDYLISKGYKDVKNAGA